MPFELAFHPEALREWRKLAERLIEPRIPASKRRGSTDRTKIKLHAAGFRLVDEVRDQQILVLVVAAGKRERNAVDRLSTSAEALTPWLIPFVPSWISCAGRTPG